MKTEKKSIELVVNGEPLTTRAGTLDALLIELNRDGDLLATAVNGAFIPRGSRDVTVLQQGDKIELVAPCLLYTSPSPRDATLSRMPSSA